MKNKKNLMIIIVSIVCVVALMIGVSTTLRSNNNSAAFSDKNDMLEVINGTWRTGDSEFDFILTVDGEVALFAMEGKEDDPDNIVCVPDKGYFYYESAEDTKVNRYYGTKSNGRYLIKHGDWEFKKVE